MTGPRATTSTDRASFVTAPETQVATPAPPASPLAMETGLRRRRAPGGLHSTDPRGDPAFATGFEARAPRASGVAHMLATNDDKVPVATSATIAFGLLAPVRVGHESLLAVNRERAGPSRLIHPLAWDAPVRADVEPRLPPRDRALATAERELAALRLAIEPPAGPVPGRRGGLRDAMDVAAAPARWLGWMQRDAIALSALVGLDEAARGGSVDAASRAAARDITAVNLATARGFEARYAKTRVELALAWHLDCLALDQAGPPPHEMRARLHAPLDDAAIDRALAGVRADWRPSTRELLRLHARAGQSFDAAQQALQAAQATRRQAQVAALDRMAASTALRSPRGRVPPQAASTADQALLAVAATAGAEAASLPGSLARLRGQLLARVAADDTASLPVDLAMELVLEAAAATFGHPDAAAQALQALSTCRPEDWPAQVRQRPGSPASRLGLALARLPRGAELLSRVCQDSDMAADPQRRVALRCFAIAHHALDGMDEARRASATGRHLALARGGAEAILSSGVHSPAGLGDAQRFAFNAVRNGLTDVGPGSLLHGADEMMAALSGRLLQPPAAEGPIARWVGRLLGRFDPRAAPTPFNPQALSSAGRVLRQGSLIGEPLKAMADLRQAFESLDLPVRLPAAQALRETLGRVLAAVPVDRPEQLAAFSSRDPLAFAPRFGLDEQALAAEPALKALWQRHARRDQLDAIARGLQAWMPLDDPQAQAGVREIPPQFGLPPALVQGDERLRELHAVAPGLPAGEVATRLARIAHDDLISATRASPVEVARDVVLLLEDQLGEAAAGPVRALRRQFDFARATALWADPHLRLATPERLLEAQLTLFRGLRLRSRVLLQGDRTVGFDGAKFTLGLASGDGGAGSQFLRPHVGGRLQQGVNLEFRFSTAAFSLFIARQHGRQWKAGASAGQALEFGRSEDGMLRGGVRAVEGGAIVSREWMDQGDSLEIVIPREIATEARNLRECEEAMRLLVMWKSCGYASPARAILSNVDVASINRMARNDRVATRTEMLLAGGQPQGGFGPVQLRAGPGLRSLADEKAWHVAAASGYYRIDDIRLDRLKQQAVAWSHAGSLRLAEAGPASVALSDLSAASREGQLPALQYALLRRVTRDGEMLTGASRFTRTWSAFEPYAQAMRERRAAWIDIASRYTQFPADFTPGLKLAASERHFEDWLGYQQRIHSRFSEYSTLMAFHPSVGPYVDGLAALQALSASGTAPDEGKAVAARDLRAAQNHLLADPASVVDRRSAVGLALTAADRPGGHVLGLTGNVGGNAYFIAALGDDPYPPFRFAPGAQS